MGLSVSDLILGGGHGRTYTPAEQEAYSRRFPSLVWRNGVPYTPQSAVEGPGAEGPNAQYSGLTGREDQPDALVEANLDDPNFLAQLARFAAATTAMEFGAGQLPGGGGDFSFMGGGSGAVGGGAAAPSLGLPTLGALPGLTTGATLAAPGLATGATLGALPGLTAGATLAAPTMGLPTLGALPGLTTGALAGPAVRRALMPTIRQAATVIGGAGQIADRYNQSRAADDSAQAVNNLAYDRNAIARYNSELDASRLDLDRRKYSDDAYQQAVKDRVYGEMLQQLQDFTVTPPPGIRMGTITGGLRPSTIANRGAIGSEVATSANTRMTTPATLPDLPTAPDLSDTGLENSGLDSLMEYLSLGGGLVETGRDIYGRLRPASAPPPASSRTPTTQPARSTFGAELSGAANADPMGVLDRNRNRRLNANFYPGGVDPFAPLPLPAGSTPRRY